MKYYIILAVKRSNPKIVYGLTEWRCSKNWNMSGQRVRLYPAQPRKKRGNALSNWQKECRQSEGYHKWNLVKQIMKEAKHKINTNIYDIFVCRANSRLCPVKVDLSLRESNQFPSEKEYDYFNPRFEVL